MSITIYRDAENAGSEIQEHVCYARRVTVAHNTVFTRGDRRGVLLFSAGLGLSAVAIVPLAFPFLRILYGFLGTHEQLLSACRCLISMKLVTHNKLA